MRRALFPIIFGQPAFLPEAKALFAAMTVQPPNWYARLLNTTYRDLISTGLLPKIDLSYLMSAHDEQASRLNLKVPGTNTLALVSAPVFTPFVGWKGDGVDDVLNAAWTSVSGGPWNSSQDSQVAGIWVEQAASYDGSTARIDLYTGSGQLGRRQNTNNAHYTYRAGDGTPTPVDLGSAGAQVGHFAYRRNAASGAGSKALFRAGASINASNVTSTSQPNQFRIFGVAGGFSDAQISVAYAAGALTDGEISTLHSIMSAYRIGVGLS